MLYFPLHIRPSFGFQPEIPLAIVESSKAGEGFEMLLPSQVTLSTSDCIYLTRAVSSLHGSAVENTGEDGIAQGHPAIGPCFHSAHRMRKWAEKIRLPFFLYGKNINLGCFCNPGLKSLEKERWTEMHRENERIAKEVETFAIDSGGEKKGILILYLWGLIKEAMKKEGSKTPEQMVSTVKIKWGN